MQQQPEFSHWLHAMHLQQQQQQPHTASSWADTDSDSDSDSDSATEHFGFHAMAHMHALKHKHAHSKMAPAFERTAPMLIPQASRSRRRSRVQSTAFFVNEFECESMPRQHAFGSDYDHSSQSDCSSSLAHSTSSDCNSDGSTSDDDIDEDDPALYQNLAFFRSQHARSKQLNGARSRSSSPLPRSVLTSNSSSDNDDNDDIFDMEL